MKKDALTLKYGKGHWKWYEQVQLNEKYHCVKFDIYHVHGVWENQNIKIFCAMPDDWPVSPKWSSHWLTFFTWVKKAFIFQISYFRFNISLKLTLEAAVEVAMASWCCWCAKRDCSSLICSCSLRALCSCCSCRSSSSLSSSNCYITKITARRLIMLRRLTFKYCRKRKTC